MLLTPPTLLPFLDVLEIQDLWLQNEVRNGRLQVRKLAGDRNPTDLMTKALSLADIKRKLDEINIKLIENQ